MTHEIYDDLDELPPPPRNDIPEGDRDLLELAARALGARFEEVDGEGYGNLHFDDGTVVHAWNSLQFSGDALELAASLQAQIDYTGRGHRNTGDVMATCGPNVSISEPKRGDVAGATRRAVTRVAAEIGKRHSF